ncbi:MAG TPA: ATP-binding protein [Candidatus Polarisedimenticolaceae bacterium]|nr:ATP-binding protein [Candidatus Polarisedimenticolaceae bacterium]
MGGEAVVNDAERRRAASPRLPFPLDRRSFVFRFRRSFTSTTDGINRTVKDIMKRASLTGCLADHHAELEIALREALANAVMHGNRQDGTKKVLVRAYCDPSQGFVIAVRDEGNGFDPAAVPDPRNEDRRHLSHGRGIFLMRELMDHIEHRKGGREVVLFKKLR